MLKVHKFVERLQLCYKSEWLLNTMRDTKLHVLYKKLNVVGLFGFVLPIYFYFYVSIIIGKHNLNNLIYYLFMQLSTIMVNTCLKSNNLITILNVN